MGLRISVHVGIVVLALILTCVSPGAAEDTACGDVDGDGKRNLRDAFRLLHAAVAPILECPLRRCDVTGDREITVGDSLAMLRYAVGLPEDLDCMLGVCAVPLEEDLLPSLTFGLSDRYEMEPGTSRTFELGLFECCYYVEQIDVCATFSVSPEGAGASIDPYTGRFELGGDVADGSEFTVIADVEHGRETVTAFVHVYEPSLNPLRGYRSEVSQIPCDDGEEYSPAEPIRELVFYSYGQFQVTWEPFEVYVDYWGDYAFDLETGALSMTIVNGNSIPWDFDGNGYVTFEGDQVVLRDIWLGNRDGTGALHACGHRFE